MVYQRYHNTITACGGVCVSADAVQVLVDHEPLLLCTLTTSCLPQATEAETKEDREIICEEVFCDITGQLDFAAKGGLAEFQLSATLGMARQASLGM